MRMRAFAQRCMQEILRDRLNLAFGLGLPLILLLLLSMIAKNAPVDLFHIEQLTPGVAVFGLSFVSLFSGMLIARDRESSFMLRLFTSPMTAFDFIGGYTLPLLPLAVAQSAVCFFAALFLGLHVTASILVTLVVLMPSAVLFIAIGLLCGSVFTDRQVGGVCGALLTNVSAWLSGTWFDPKLVGGAFETIAAVLPFQHAVDAGRAALAGNYAAVFPDLWWVIGYAAGVLLIAILVFQKKMHADQA